MDGGGTHVLLLNGGSSGDICQGVADMARAGFCTVCGKNVWVVPTGEGSCGHAGIVNIYEAGEPSAMGGLGRDSATTGRTDVTAAPAPKAGQEASPGRFKRFIMSPKKSIPVGAAVVALIVLGIVFFPRPEFVASALRVPESVVSGEDIVVTVDLANEGWAKGEVELTVLMNGQAVQTATASLAAGAEEAVRITIPGSQSPGVYEFALAEWEGLKGDVWVMTPPQFDIASVDVSPNPLDLNKGKGATVLARVSNVGEAEGSHTLRLTMDGEVVEERELHLEGGSTAEESFSIEISEPGPCEVAVDDVSVDLEVHTIQRPANGTAIVNKIGGGANRLKVTNNNEKDVLVVFSKPGDGQPALLAVLVRAKSSYTVRGLKDGTYTCYYVHGSAWCTHCKRFSEGAMYGQFEGDSRLKSGGGTYTESSVTFGITSGAGTPTDAVDEDDFPTM
jgi:hypothetical protein